MKAIICPKCKMDTGFYPASPIVPDSAILSCPYPLYQRSGDKPISPRCSECYDKDVKRLGKEVRNNA